MRRVLLLVPLLALAGCQKEESSQRPVKVTVTYSGFLPECVRVEARDADGGGVLSEDVPGKGELGTGGQLVVAVFPPEDWGSSVTVEAQAFEKTCTGKMVVNQTQPVTLTRGKAVEAALQLAATDQDQDGYVAAPSGTDCRDDLRAVNPAAVERCNNDVDDNCNGMSAMVELRLGQACTEGQSCQGTFECSADGTVVCGGIPNVMLAYPDGDGDGHGERTATARSVCGPAPTGYVIGPNDDCDDSRGTVYGGAPERCDTVDNDCDGTADEDFPGLNATCLDPATQCSGQRQCNGDGSALTCVTTPPSTWYPDEDGDGFGDDGGLTRSCVQPSGFISQDGDCDDGNRFTHTGATELCDGLDNDCDNAPEAAARCPNGGPTWAERTVGTSSQRWISASTWTPGGVWAVGENNSRALLTPSGTEFQVLNSAGNSCGSSGTSWYTVWADPDDNGRAYFGSASGRLAWQDTGSTTCTQPTTLASFILPAYGLVGVRNSGTLGLYGVSASTSANEGAAFLWNGATAVTFSSANDDLAFVFDIHGRSRDMIFAVGGFDGTTGVSAGPRIYRFNPGNNRWEPPTMETSPGLSQLKGVWVVNDKVAFAVGNAGSVMRWNGTAWSRLPFPSTDNLTSVIAFGASSAYAVSNSGRIYRYDGQSWQQIHELPGVQFKDITGTSPEDLWVVGTSGRILHWPQ